jgi:hypothetical protein
LHAFTDGVRRVWSAPALLAGVFFLTCALALPLALSVRSAIDAHLGSSLVADRVASGVDYGWWEEFSTQATGLGTTFSPTIIGFAAVLDNISGVLDGRAPIGAIAWAGAAYVGAWTFLLGGIIDRLARQRRTRALAFFGVSGGVVCRLLRLAIIAVAAYAFLFLHVHRWLFDVWYAAEIRNLDSERTAFAWRCLMYAIFGTLLVTINMLFDYAKIRAIVEDRRSAIGALMAGARFCWHQRSAVAGVYALDTALFLLLMAVWSRIAPGVGAAGAGTWARFAFVEVFLVARVFLKLQFIASQTSLFQSRLAHARYMAVPTPLWPQSPNAEAIPVR